MVNYLKIEGLENIDSAEATFGDALLCGNRLIIPYFNVLIIPTDNYLKGVKGGRQSSKELNEYLKSEVGKYIKFCYLVFEGTSGIVWDYDLSRAMNAEKRECYGGVYYYNKEDYEFWIEYDRGLIYLENNYLASLQPWGGLKDYDEPFFQSASLVRTI